MSATTAAEAAGALRVAVLTPCYWPEVNRGAERIARELAGQLVGRGHRVRIITSHPGRTTRSREAGIDVLRLRRAPDGLLRRRHFEDYLTHAPFSYLALLAGHDHVAHAQAAADAIAAARWGHRRRAPVVFSYMGLPTRAHLTGRRGRLATVARACRQCDRVTALSKAAADSFWTELGVRAQVIHPGVDLDRFSPGGARADEPTIFCAATLDVPYKRVEMLVRALPYVRRERPTTRLVLLRPPDDQLADRLRTNFDGLEFVAPLPGGDDSVLLANYRRAWVTALPAIGETFGLVLVESLACGTAVVGTASGGIPEIIDRSEIGRRFDGDERALAAALLEALELSEQASTAAACRERALALSSDRTASAYESLYHELLRHTGPSRGSD